MPRWHHSRSCNALMRFRMRPGGSLTSGRSPYLGPAHLHCTPAPTSGPPRAPAPGRGPDRKDRDPPRARGMRQRWHQGRHTDPPATCRPTRRRRRTACSGCTRRTRGP
eukprot:1769273-Pyramimonas_sp.AAC.1